MKMSNKLLGVTLIVSISSFGLMNCKSTNNMLENTTKTYKSEEWIDDHTFQVKSIGAPRKGEKSLVKRKVQSKNAAKLSAQNRIIELLLGSEVSSTSSATDGESGEVLIRSELEGIIKGGSIISESFDDEQNCEMVFRIHGKNLKKKAKAEVTK